MAVDFDFDTNYNEESDDENQPEEALEDLEFEDEEIEEEFEDEEDEEEPPKRNPLRTILLALLVLVLLCAVCYLASRFMPLPIPGFGGSAPPPPAPVQDTPAPVEEDSAVVDEPVAGEAATEGEADAIAEGSEEQPAAGEATEGEISEDALTEGEAVEGDATEGEAVEGDATEGEAAEGDATEGEAVEGDATEDEAVEGDATEGEAVEGDATEGEAVEGDATEDEAVDESTGDADEADEEPDIILSTTPVPGPTATPNPNMDSDSDTSAAAICDESNALPIADAGGSYEGMMGKGQAIIIFDGSGSSDSDGTIESYEWDFGDGSTWGSGETVRHGYTVTGTFTVSLTVIDDCGAENESVAEVTVSGTMLPETDEESNEDSEDDNTDTDDTPDTPAYAPPPVDPTLGTAGFCYRVQPGNTLYGIATNFGVALPDLAFVNGVSPNYYVIAGQGLFVPADPVNPYGPNIYQVQPGDTLHSIAFLCGLTTTDLAHTNGLSSETILTPGQIVTIPPPWSY